MFFSNGKSLFLTIKQSSESDLGHQTRKPDNFGHRTIRNWTSSAFTWFQRWFWIYLYFLKNNKYGLTSKNL